MNFTSRSQGAIAAVGATLCDGSIKEQKTEVMAAVVVYLMFAYYCLTLVAVAKYGLVSPKKVGLSENCLKFIP